MTESRMNRRESPMNPNEPPKENTTGLLRLFVYGTLKRGCWNHERFCRGVLSVEEAVVRGRLYELPSGIPVLEVPEADVLAHGTANPLADVATCLRADTHRQAQARPAGHLASYHEPMPDKSAGQRIWTCQRHARRVRRAMDGEHQSATVGGWCPVYGELLTFDDPESRLPAIDRLEGFHPGGSNMYCRVLVPAITGETVVPVWLYVGDEIIKRRLAPLGKSRWL